MAGDSRRALVLRRVDADPGDIERLVRRYHLDVVFTAVVDTTSKLAVIIAVQHLLEHDAEVVVVPHLTVEGRTGAHWRAVTVLADLVTAGTVVERGTFDRPTR
ncbi:MAG: hypothetical protein HOQ36_03360 [Nocardia sp.]|nr:hypothetical protein [Nocardia sp.]NUS91441.1 hypothetical protein [Nocardia sp.]